MDSTDSNSAVTKTNFLERNEHSFAQYIRILGKGKRGTRSFTREEARAAMGQILDGQVLDLQLGAFLMLLRVKEETPDEIAGFVEAAQLELDARTHGKFSDIAVDLDWSSYAGKRRHVPWFLLSIKALASAGYRIFVHGAAGHTHGRLYTQDLAASLHIPLAASPGEAATALDKYNCVFMPLKMIWPRLEDIIQMRSILGLRSPIHSMARLLNPCRASAVIQGVFHPPYLAIHQHAGLALGYRSTLVIKGEGGEIERNPDAKTLAHWTRPEQDPAHGVDELLPMFERRHMKPDTLDPSALNALWRGERDDEYGEAAVISTIELGLRAIKPGTEGLADEARQIWADRDRTLVAQYGEHHGCPLV